MKSKTLNIVINPPKDIIKLAMKTSKKLGGEFVLDCKDYFPHITLYMSEFPEKNLVKIGKTLKNSLENCKSFKLIDTRKCGGKRGYVYATYMRDKNIASFQKKIVELLNPLRENLIRQKDLDRLQTYTKAERENVKRYGYRLAGRLYNPHLTLTKFPEDKIIDIKKIRIPDLSFTVNEIGLYYGEEFGTCNDLIAKFNLKK